MSEFYPHRSALYMPGSNERALEKAKSLPADLFIFDMEDAVSPENKELARDLILNVLYYNVFLTPFFSFIVGLVLIYLWTLSRSA